MSWSGPEDGQPQDDAGAQAHAGHGWSGAAVPPQGSYSAPAWGAPQVPPTQQQQQPAVWAQPGAWPQQPQPQPGGWQAPPPPAGWQQPTPQPRGQQGGWQPHGQPYAAQQPHGQWAPAPPPPPKRPALLAAALPMPGQAYHSALRPLESRVGRWFLAWAIALGFFVVGQLVGAAFMLPGILEAMLTLPPASLDDPEAIADAVLQAVGSPFGMLGVNLGWAAMIPGAIVAIAAFGARAAGFASSVLGGWRWGAVGRSAITIVPIFALYIGVTLSLDGSVEWTWDPNWALVAVVLLTTPLQATGEEFAFRGFLTQMLGGWARQRWVPGVVIALLAALVLMLLSAQGLAPSLGIAIAVAVAVAAVGPWVSGRRPLPTALWIGASTGLLFGALHGHVSVAATLQLSLVGFACSMLTFRTGGLEAASVLHTANNVFIMVPLALTGQSAFSAQPVSGEDWLSLGLATLALGLAYLGVHLTMPKAQRRTTGAPGAELLEPQPQLAGPAPAMAPTR